MEELRREQMCDRNEILMFDILQELKNISAKLDGYKPIEKPIVKIEKPKGKVCKHCGEVHERPVDYANCGRKKRSVK